MHETIPVLDCYIPENKTSDIAVVILPGGGYGNRAPHEGQGYAEFLNAHGISAFVCQYRVKPHSFPLPLLDARRAIRYVRYHSEEFGIDKKKVYLMGSSAGGHLAALVSTYRGEVDFEGLDAVDAEDYLPNAQILCYPVICNPENDFAHRGSYHNLLESRETEDERKVDPSILADEKTPTAFIWHTAGDAGVNVINSYRYAEKLRTLNVPVEMHIFPYGPHGLGLAPKHPHVAQWSGLLLNWLRLLEWL
jgi:acetyl esterase/lipase